MRACADACDTMRMQDPTLGSANAMAITVTPPPTYLLSGQQEIARHRLYLSAVAAAEQRARRQAQTEQRRSKRQRQRNGHLWWRDSRLASQQRRVIVQNLPYGLKAAHVRSRLRSSLARAAEAGLFGEENEPLRPSGGGGRAGDGASEAEGSGVSEGSDGMENGIDLGEDLTTVEEGAPCDGSTEEDDEGEEEEDEGEEKEVVVMEEEKDMIRLVEMGKVAGQPDEEDVEDEGVEDKALEQRRRGARLTARYVPSVWVGSDRFGRCRGVGIISGAST